MLQIPDALTAVLQDSMLELLGEALPGFHFYSNEIITKFSLEHFLINEKLFLKY